MSFFFLYGGIDYEVFSDVLEFSLYIWSSSWISFRWLITFFCCFWQVRAVFWFDPYLLLYLYRFIFIVSILIILLFLFYKFIIIIIGFSTSIGFCIFCIHVAGVGW